jgi:hypothetical protein
MVKIRKPNKKKEAPVVAAAESIDLAAISLTLASHGRDYGDWMPEGVVKIRPPLFLEVKYFAQMNPTNYEENITELLKALIASPMIDPLDLTAGDRTHLHLWVRGQVDPFYRIKVMCPFCSHVDEAYDFPIESVPIKEIPEQYSSPFELDLPGSGSKVVLRLETGRDRLKRPELIKMGFSEYHARLAFSVMLIDGKVVDPEKACQWLVALPPKDGLMISEFAKWSDHGPDFKGCSMKCRKCERNSQMALPFRLDFYQPSVSAARSLGDAVDRRAVRERGDLPGDAGDRSDGDRGVPVRATEGQ